MGEPAYLPDKERARLIRLAKDVYDAICEDKEPPYIDEVDMHLVMVEYARLCGVVP